MPCPLLPRLRSLRLTRALVALAVVAFALPASAVAAAPSKPNIVVILVDDMGWADIGCYGSEIPTPNLDRLAAGGVRFTQFYNTGRCCPTRASLLTGLYPHQAGVGHMVNDAGEAFPGYRGRLHAHTPTIAEVLRPAGYFTAMTGKWHVGHTAGVTPTTRGFDRALHAAAGGFYRPGVERAKLFLHDEPLADADPRLPKDWYSTDLWTDFGLKFIDDARAAQKPFFLYLAHNAPHFPLQASAADIARFRGQYQAGCDKRRAARHARHKELGLVDSAWPLAPRVDAIAAWDSLSAAERDRFDHLMAVYAACVFAMDRAVGRLVDGLRDRGVLDNTLILFLSDNGGNAEAGVNGRSEGDPTRADSNWFSGESWAHLQNTPFRRYKHYNHEGGIASPLIAHWPAAMPAARRGTLESTPAHLVDLLATAVDLAGATFPREQAGRATVAPEGRSFVPLLTFARPAPPPERALFWEHEGNAAVRLGDWKLVRQGRTGPWELYNLKLDRTELRDLSAAEPARAKDLAARWEAWARRADALPAPPAAPGGKKKNAKSAK